jgi:prepilin-type N-terminal cleavage/methylation domain-containing protein
VSAHKHSGYTLAELLIALTIGGLVMTLAFHALLAHGQFAGSLSERARIQQHGRGALELIAAELRSADPAGIAEANTSAVSFISLRTWGVVCRHTEARVSVLVPGSGGLDPDDEWLAVPPVGSSLVWQFLPVADLTGSSSERAAAASECSALGASIIPSTGADSEARMYGPRVAQGTGGTLGLAAGEAGLEQGRPTYFFDRTRYDVATSSVGPGLWIRRNSGPAMQMHPLAGPVRPGGLRFDYYSEDGEILPSPVAEADRRRIRRVGVSIVAQSRPGAGALQQDSGYVLVVLRNAL